MHATCPVCRCAPLTSGCIMLTTDEAVLDHMRGWKPVTLLSVPSSASVPPSHPVQEQPLGGWVLYTAVEMTRVLQWMCEGLPSEVDSYQLVIRPERMHTPGNHLVLYIEARPPQGLEKWVANAFSEHEPPFGNFWIVN